MKTLRFENSLRELILAGTKTTTWRLNDEKDISVNDTLSFLDKNGNQFALAKVCEVRLKTFGRLNTSDKEGYESFSSDE